LAKTRPKSFQPGVIKKINVLNPRGEVKPYLIQIEGSDQQFLAPQDVDAVVKALPICPCCGKDAWENPAGQYCSQQCKSQQEGPEDSVPKAPCRAECGKPSWNGERNEFCSKTCREEFAQASVLRPSPPDDMPVPVASGRSIASSATPLAAPDTGMSIGVASGYSSSPAICSNRGCGKPTYNGAPGEFCSQECKQAGGLRIAIGQKVRCYLGEKSGWVTGEVVKHNPKADKAYEVKLDYLMAGCTVPKDSAKVIQALNNSVWARLSEKGKEKDGMQKRLLQKNTALEEAEKIVAGAWFGISSKAKAAKEDVARLKSEIDELEKALAPAEAPTFEKTKYHQLYQNETRDFNFFDGVAVLHGFIEAVGKERGISRKDVDRFISEISEELQKGTLQNVTTIATTLWTSAATLDEKELCSHINDAVCDDASPLIDKVVPVCRIMNKLVVNRMTMSSVPWPEDSQTYRGLGMPEEYFDFFTEGTVYRVNRFIASSLRRAVAEDFMRLNATGGKSAVVFTIKFNPQLKCSHVNYLQNISLVKGEDEYLLPPYSGFKVISANINPGEVSEIVIYAFPDNMLPELNDVPLAPWH
jgi:hypothetical protein